MEWIELSCKSCDWRSQCGPPQMLHWLRAAGMVRRDTSPEPELLAELLRAAAARLICPKCQSTELIAAAADDGQQDEDWGIVRACADCGKPIPLERLEVFPTAELCVACQRRSDRGEAIGQPDFCPRCGNVMSLRQVRRGVTRYVLACTSCRSEGQRL